MKFDKLRLTGFKSFVEATDIHIEPGLTGVVGPNGCGKSNLVEALRWAMGEGSYKSVRGTSMDDVIFAGSGRRPARDTAEVTLFLDNKEHSAPAEVGKADILEVTRRITRSLGSDYRINGKLVRAQDVKLLFADAATGSRSPSMVRQGQVAELIAAKPTDRRNVLEEAAGIAGLRARKHEATLKLNQAEQNLSRVDDVGQEVERQVEALKRQARQARRYKALSEEIRKLEATVHHLRWVEARNAARDAESAVTAARTALTQRAAEQTRAATDQAAAEHKMPALREAEAAASAARQRIAQALATLDLEEKQAKERIAAIAKTVEDLTADLAAQDRTRGDADAALARLTTEAAELRAADEGAEARLDALQQRLRDTARAAEEAEQAATLATERAATAQAARKAADARLSRATDAERTARTRFERAETAAAATDVAAPLAARDKAAAELAEAERAATEAGEALAAAETAMPDARRADADAAAELQRLEAAIRGRQTEAAALTRLTATLGEAGGILDACTVAPGYEPAFAAALGDDLSAPISDTAPARWSATPPEAPDARLPEGAEPLSRFVTGPPALARRLAQIGVIEAFPTAPLAAGQRLVTQDGALMRWDGYARAAGAPSAAAEKLAQKNRLAALEAELADLHPQEEAARSTAEAARRTLSEAAAAEKAARRAEQTARQLIGAARSAYAKAEEHARKAEAAVATRAAERATAEAALGAATAEREAAEAERAQTSAGEQEASDRAKAQQHAATARKTAREAESASEAERRAVFGRRRRLERVDAERSDWSQRIATADTQRAALAARLEKAKAAHATHAGAPSETAAERARIVRQLDAADAKAKATADARAQGERAEAAARKTARAALDALAEARETAGRAEERDAAAVARLNQVIQDLTEALHTAPEHAHQQAGLDPAAPLPDRAASEQRLERLKIERERLGGVNLVAEDELAELEERRGSMMAERDDLIAAIEKLRQGIKELNKEARARLIASFDTVNAQFQRLFTHLFGGGEAELQLTEADDPLDAGLDIIARPPGKKPQSLSLLSGGEQTLTATALIFAVFLTNPAPICVLDEIDAPLDDANVERFCALLDEMTRSTDTRFLIITHNPITMAKMHRLYGVTMVERGVSQLVSVTLADADELRESA